MVFHRFQQLTVELSLQVWEYALNEAILIDGLLTDNQKPICYIITPRGSLGSPRPRSKLLTFEYMSLGHVCHESREVLSRCGQLHKAHDYKLSADVVYVDNYYALITIPKTLMLMFRKHYNQRSLPRGPALGKLLLENDGKSFYNSLCLPGLESITVALPPLEKSMPYYAGYSPIVMRSSFLRPVPYSEVQRIKIEGPYTYGSWLRGFVNTKRRFLGSLIQDVNEIWKGESSFVLNGDDARQEITVQAGVLQYLEGPFEGKTRLSPIYKEAEDVEENQAADQDSSLS